MKRDLGALVEGKVEIPTMPSGARKVQEILADSNINAANAASLIASDQGIATQIMRIASSASFGTIRPDNLQAAITRIGFIETRYVVLAVAIKALFQRLDMFERRLWEHSLRVAIVARELSEQYVPEHSASAFLAGQLHDIGMIVISNHCRSLYSQAAYEPSVEVSAAEQEELGFTHHDVGSIVARRWELAPIFQEVCLYHDDLALAASVESDRIGLIAAVTVADHICHSQSKQAVCNAAALSENACDALEILGIATKRYSRVAEKLFVSASRERALMG